MRSEWMGRKEGGKKEKEKDRGKTGKRQGKDRKKTGERQGKRQDFARLLTPKQAVWAKNSIFLA